MPVSIVTVLPQINREQSEDELAGGLKFEIKPFLLCLKFAGLHHFSFSDDGRRKCFRKIAFVYRVFVPCVLIVNFIISLGEFTNVQGFDSTLLNNLISSIWFMQVTLFSVNNTIRCWRWDRFYKKWDNYNETYKTDYKNKNKKTATTAVICYIIWLLVAAAFMAVSMSSPRPPSGFLVYLPEELIFLMTSFIVVAYFFFVSTWFLLTSQFAIVSISLCRLLEDLYQKIKRCFENREKISEQIEGFRQQHDIICVMILLADDILAMFIMVTVASTIPLIVLTLYFVIFVTDEVEMFSYVATWWSISLSTLQLAIVFLFGGAVNYMVSNTIGSTCIQFFLDRMHV